MEKRDKKISELSGIIKDKKEKKGQIIKATEKITKLKKKNRKSFNLVVKYKKRIHYDLLHQEPITRIIEEIIDTLKLEETRSVAVIPPPLSPSPLPNDDTIKDEYIRAMQSENVLGKRNIEHNNVASAIRKWDGRLTKWDCLEDLRNSISLTRENSPSDSSSLSDSKSISLTSVSSMSDSLGPSSISEYLENISLIDISYDHNIASKVNRDKTLEKEVMESGDDLSLTASKKEIVIYRV